MFALVVVGCFSPTLDSELRCSQGLCPQGFRCENGVCLTGRTGSEADSGPDEPGPCYGEHATQVVPGTVHSGNTKENGFNNADGCDAEGVEDYYELALADSDLPATVTIDALTTNYDLVLRVRQASCEDESAEFICEDNNDGEDGDIVTRSISVASSYFILIDSHDDDNGGTYELVVTVEPE